MDAAYYLETIHTVFQDFSLVKGTWDVKSVDGQPERVRPQDITNSAVLTVEGELDDISGAGQTRAAHDLCTGIAPENHKHIEVQGAGHYGIFSGRRWREVVYPQVRDFILQHALPTATPEIAGHDGAPAPQAPAAVPADTPQQAQAEAPAEVASPAPMAVQTPPAAAKSPAKGKSRATRGPRRT
ncbi:hypothetical protein D3C78_1373440 [compost metagenome]